MFQNQGNTQHQNQDLMVESVLSGTIGVPVHDDLDFNKIDAQLAVELKGGLEKYELSDVSELPDEIAQTKQALDLARSKKKIKQVQELEQKLQELEHLMQLAEQLRPVVEPRAESQLLAAGLEKYELSDVSELPDEIAQTKQALDLARSKKKIKQVQELEQKLQELEHLMQLAEQLRPVVEPTVESQLLAAGLEKYELSDASELPDEIVQTKRALEIARTKNRVKQAQDLEQKLQELEHLMQLATIRVRCDLGNVTSSSADIAQSLDTQTTVAIPAQNLAQPLIDRVIDENSVRKDNLQVFDLKDKNPSAGITAKTHALSGSIPELRSHASPTEVVDFQKLAYVDCSILNASTESMVILEKMPECAEKTLNDLIDSCSQLISQKSSPDFESALVQELPHLKRMLVDLEQQLEQENLGDVLVQKVILIRQRLGSVGNISVDVESVKSDCFKVLREIRPLDMQLMIDLLQQADLATVRLKDQTVLLLLGVTGSGKSTTIHFLAGSKMKEVDVDGLDHIEPVSVKPHLESFRTSPLPCSETRNVNAVQIATESGEHLALCDTPGFGDTGGPEIDIANGIGIVKAIRHSRRVKPIVLISKQSIGDRWEGITKLCHTLTRFVSHIEMQLPAFSYVFTKGFKRPKGIQTQLKHKLENLTDAERSNAAFVAILKDMVSKTAVESEVILLNPLEDDPIGLLGTLTSSAYIENPADGFVDFVSVQSLEVLTEHLNKQHIAILHALTRFDAASALKYKLDQLRFLNQSLGLNEIRVIYDDCMKEVVRFIEKQEKSLFEKLDSSLVSNIDVSDPIKACAKETLRLVSMEGIRQQHLPHLPNLVDSAATKVLGLQTQLLDCVQGHLSSLEIQSLNSDLDKMRLLSLHFSEVHPVFGKIHQIYKETCEHLLNFCVDGCKTAADTLENLELEKLLAQLNTLKNFRDFLGEHLDQKQMDAYYQGSKNGLVLLLEKCARSQEFFGTKLFLSNEQMDQFLRSVDIMRNLLQIGLIEQHLNVKELHSARQHLLNTCVQFFDVLFSDDVPEVGSQLKIGLRANDSVLGLAAFPSFRASLRMLDYLRRDPEIAGLLEQKRSVVVAKFRRHIRQTFDTTVTCLDSFGSLEFESAFLEQFLALSSQLKEAEQALVGFEEVYNGEFESIAKKLTALLDRVQLSIEHLPDGLELNFQTMQPVYSHVKQAQRFERLLSIMPSIQSKLDLIQSSFFKKVQSALECIEALEERCLNSDDNLLKAILCLQSCSMVSECALEHQAAQSALNNFLRTLFSLREQSLSDQWALVSNGLEQEATDQLMPQFDLSVEQLYKSFESVHQSTIFYQRVLSAFNVFQSTEQRLLLDDPAFNVKEVFYTAPMQLMQRWLYGEEAVLPKHVLVLLNHLDTHEKEVNFQLLARLMVFSRKLSKIDPFIKAPTKYSEVAQQAELSIRRLNTSIMGQLKLHLTLYQFEDFLKEFAKLDQQDLAMQTELEAARQDFKKSIVDLTNSLSGSIEKFSFMAANFSVESLKHLLTDLGILCSTESQMLAFLGDEEFSIELKRRNKELEGRLVEKVTGLSDAIDLEITQENFFNAEKGFLKLKEIVDCLRSVSLWPEVQDLLLSKLEKQRLCIQEKLAVVVRDYEVLAFSEFSQSNLLRLCEQFSLLEKEGQTADYAPVYQQLLTTVRSRMVHFLNTITTTEAIEEGEERLAIIESIRLYLPIDLYASLGEVIKNGHEHLKLLREKGQRELDEAAAAEKIRELVQKLIGYAQKYQYGFMGDARTRIQTLIHRGATRFKADLAKGDLMTVLENLPKAWHDWVYYSTQLGKLTLPPNQEYAARYKHLYQDEQCLKLCVEILQDIGKTYTRLLDTLKPSEKSDAEWLVQLSLHFNKLVFFLRLKKEQPLFYQHLVQQNPELPAKVKNVFYGLQAFLKRIRNDFDEKLKSDNFLELKKIMDTMKEQQDFFGTIQDYLGTPLCLEETPFLKDSLGEGFFSYDEMRKLLGEQVLAWHEQCTREVFLGHPRTKTANVMDREGFYQEIYLSYKHLKQIRVLSSHIDTGALDVHTVEAKCEEHIEKQIRNLGEHVDRLLDGIPSSEPRVYADYNLGYDNLRVMCVCFEDSRLAQFAKTKIVEIDRKFDLKIAALREEARKESGIKKIVDIFITLKTMSVNIPICKSRIDVQIDQLLLDFKKESDGAKKVGILGLELNTPANGPIAQMLIAEHSAFKGYSLALRNQKVLSFTIDDVLSEVREVTSGQVKGLRCVDYHVTPASHSIEREFLKEHYRVFDEEYWSLVEQGLLDVAAGKEKILSNTRLVADGTEPDKVRKLIAHVFAYWTLSHAEYFREAAASGLESTSNSRKKYLMQPHAAQVVAIFRLFSIDAHPPATVLAKASHMVGSVVAAITPAFLQSSGSAGSDSGMTQLNLSNHLIQVSTGEGKSVVLAVTATVLGLLGYEVNCACYSQYLSRRDYEAFLPLFNAFSVHRFVSYGTFNQMCEDFINQNGNVRSLVEEMVQSGSTVHASKKSSVRPRILLIDEVDVFFNKDFYGNTYEPIARLTHETIKNLADHIWRLRKDPRALQWSNIKKSDVYLACCRQFSTWELLIEESVKTMLSDLRTFESHEYVVQGDQIGYKDQDGISFTLTYGYKTLFAHYKEQELGHISLSSLESKICLLIDCGSFSYAEMPKQYRCVMGVTGTLETLTEAEKALLRDVYQIKRYSYIPSVYGSNQLQFSGDSVRDLQLVSKERHFPGIRSEINLRLQGSLRGVNRAVLVFFESTVTLEAFYRSEHLTDLKDFVRVMTEKVSAMDKEGIIRQATSPGSITLLTREFGRGTDFICYDDSLIASGGIHVMQTFVSDEISEETQIKGRTARQGNTGSFSMVLVDSALERFGLRDAELRQMQNTGKLYSTIHEYRCKFFERQYQEGMRYVEEIKIEHDKARHFLEALVRAEREPVKGFLLARNKGVLVDSAAAVSRTIVLMDATGSMSSLIDKSKNTVKAMFERAYVVLNERSVHTAFEVQFVAYRNYTSSKEEDLLEVSPWESKPDNLRLFIDTISAHGGTWWEEAVEIGLLHAREEAEQGRLSQVILIGDAAPNTREQVRTGREKFGEQYWSSTRFSKPTYYEDELLVLKEKGIPVHAFFVESRAASSFKVIAEKTGGRSELLDINSNTGAEMLTHLVTESIMNDIGGEQLVVAYREKFRRGYVAPIRTEDSNHTTVAPVVFSQSHAVSSRTTSGKVDVKAKAHAHP